MPSPSTLPHLSAAAFERALHARLSADGFVPVSERFPLAGHELAMLDYRALAKARGGRTFVFGVKRADGFVREQLRILSDQFYNALVRETNEVRTRPTLVRGTCLFVYERTPELDLAAFLLGRVRPRTPMAIIRSVPWILDLASGKVRRPWLTSRPFPLATISRAIEDARAT